MSSYPVRQNVDVSDSDVSGEVPPDRSLAERELALAWLNRHWPQERRICPICGNPTWSISEIVELRQFQGGDLVIGGKSSIYPVFPVMCSRCGFTHFFNAVVSGIAQAKPGAN